MTAFGQHGVVNNKPRDECVGCGHDDLSHDQWGQCNMCECLTLVIIKDA